MTFGRVTLVSGSLGSAAHTCFPEEVVGAVGSDSPGGENLDACCSDQLVARDAVKGSIFGVDSRSGYPLMYGTEATLAKSIFLWQEWVAPIVLAHTTRVNSPVVFNNLL